MKKYVKRKAIKQKAAKKMYVPHLMVSSMSGVTRPMMLFVVSMRQRVHHWQSRDVQVAHPCRGCGD